MSKETHPDPLQGLHDVTVPVSLRLPADQVVRLMQYAEQMNTSMAKIVTSILEDCLPAFSGQEISKNAPRIAQVYHAMKTNDLLTTVSQEQVKDRVLQRTEPGGPMGRPSKKPKKVS